MTSLSLIQFHVVSSLLILQAVAAEQRGLFTTRQAVDAGVSADTLASWRRRGWIRTVRHGVYRFAGVPEHRWHPTIAAGLAGGKRAVLSHRSAAAIHRFEGIAPPPEPDLTVPPSPRRHLHGITLHYTGPVPDDERIVLRGVQVTTPTRTVVDLAGELDSYLLGAILDDGVVHRRWTVAEVSAALDASPRRRAGVRQLRHVLASRLEDPATNSPLEQRIVRYLAPLRPFEVQYQVVLDGQVLILDAAWPWCKVAAEIDGRSYRQRSRTAHDRESRRLTVLAAHDWKVAHLTATMTGAECVDAVRSLMPAAVQGRLSAWPAPWNHPRHNGRSPTP